MPPKELHAIRLEPERVQAIDRIAKDEGRTRADVIRRLIDEALDHRSGGRVGGPVRPSAVPGPVLMRVTGFTRETIRKISKETGND